MIHINKTTRFFSYLLFFLACFAVAAFSDSFVDENTIKSLNDFQFGQAVSSTDKMDRVAADRMIGDSFVNEAAVALLKDFRFGYIDDAEQTTDAEMTKTIAQPMRTGDSFVDLEAINQYEQDLKHLDECGYNC